MSHLKNAKHELFCREYFACRNATQAALVAGYSAKSARKYGHDLLQKQDIQKRLAELQAEKAATLGISKERWNDHMAAIAFQSMGDFMRLTSDGEPIIDLSAASETQYAAIQKIKVEDFLDGRGEDARDVRKVELSLHPKLPALVKVGEAFGYLERDDGADALDAVRKWLMGLQSHDAPLAGGFDPDAGNQA